MVAQVKKWNTEKESREFFELNISTINDNIYYPIDKSRFKETGPDERIVTFPYYVTVKMDVVGGTFWVIQEPETEFVAKGNKVIKLYECGNRISGFYILQKPTTTSLAFKPATQAPPININLNVNNSSSYPPYQQIPVVESSTNYWPLVIGATVVSGAAIVIALILNNNKTAPTTKDIPEGPGGNTGPAWKIMF
ncbi:TPA: hypothetical protein DD445_02050 [Candidatus Nomurabacteria bacterium]|nr:hypothetical protein [Candidatus Nomurabacteria bacterium]HBP27554.1 hypothetical protein [Candidatus Nomurabacteria bacterium]HBR66189.1 hypothetical protein [Candidatus Nomurabacteria bacterium]